MKKITNGTSGLETPVYYGFLVDILNEIKNILDNDFPPWELIESQEEGFYGTSMLIEDNYLEWTGMMKVLIEDEVKSIFDPNTINLVLSNEITFIILSLSLSLSLFIFCLIF